MTFLLNFYEKLMNFIENAQKNGVNTNDIFGQPNKLINHAKSSIDSIMDNIVNNVFLLHRIINLFYS